MLRERYQRWRGSTPMAMGSPTMRSTCCSTKQSTLLRHVRDIGLGLVDRAPPLEKACFIRPGPRALPGGVVAAGS